MKYYTEGYISGVEKSTDGQKEHVALKFHPLPPFFSKKTESHSVC